MHFAEPSYLLLLWLIPALVGFYLWSFRKREVLLQAFARSEMLARLLPPVSRRRQRLRAAMLTTAVVFALLALLRPQWGFHWEEITREGVDIMVAVDVSQSMLARDVQPDRLERARRELKDLLDKLQGDRIGLIAFAGTAFVQTPLTLDYGAFSMFLDYLSPDLIPVPGTSITEAIRAARESFLRQSSTSRALILITDGEDHEGEVMEAAKEAKEAGIKIFAIGIGAEEGAPIPSPDGSGFLKDDGGELVMTKLDEQTLQKVAVETGGAYVRSITGDLDLDRIYLEGIKQSLESAELKSARQKRWEERFQWPLAVVVLMVLGDAFVSERGRRRAGKAAVMALVLGLAASHPARAGLLGDDTIRAGLKAYEAQDYETALQKFTDAKIEHPNDPLLDYNLGNTYYKTRQYAEAEASYQRVTARAADPQLREKAWYNLGNTAYRQGRLEDAVKHYQEALKLDPNDQDAKRNLEKVREEIRRRLEENKQQQQQRQQQQEQQQQQQPQGQDDQGGQGEPQASSQDQQEQEGQGQSQEEKQGQQAQQQGQPGKEQQARQQGKEPKPGKQNQESQAQAGKPGEQKPGEEPRQAQGVGKSGEQKKPEGDGQGAVAGGKQDQAEQPVPGQLTKDEAMRLLSQVKDEQKAGLMRQGRMRGRASRPPGGKPW